MNFKKRLILNRHFSLMTLLYLFFGFYTEGVAQTVVEGYIVDALKGDTIPFANVSLVGTSTGVTADENGHFYFTFTDTKYDSLQITAIGYAVLKQKIQIGQVQTLTLKLSTFDVMLNEVVVRKTRYRNKDNPAVELIQQVIAHKDANQPESHAFYQNRQYEKLELDLVNIGKKMTNKAFMKNVKFFFKDADTTKLEGKSLIPTYFKETSSNIYYRKSPETRKEYVLGKKETDFSGLFDAEGLGQYLNHLYVNANIYDNQLLFFKKPFMSPLSGIAPDFYRFYIMDTVVMEGKRTIKLAFFPRSKADLTFTGNLFIADDTTYAVRRVEMSVPKEININFLNSMLVVQNFERLPNGSSVLTRDEVSIDFSIVGDEKSGTGFYGKKTTNYSNFIFDKPQPDSIYAGSQNTVKRNDAEQKADVFWEKERTEPLSATEKSMYAKADSLVKVPDYQRFMAWKYFVSTGYLKTNGFEWGPTGTLVSFNDLEGKRMRIGGRTTTDFSKHWRIEGYGAYGFRDKKWKFNTALTYQFNESPFNARPQNALKAWFLDDVEVPGQNVERRDADNVLLSFRRGKFDKMYYKRSFGVQYTNENESSFMYQLGMQQRRLSPAGSLTFDRSVDASVKIKNLTTNEGFVNFRYAPNEEFFQGQTIRKHIVNKYPIFGLNFTYGNGSDAANNTFAYQDVNANVFKRFFIAPIGHTDIMIEGGRTFGKGLPYPVLHLFHANQTLNYEKQGYNQMNYLEFMSDKYASLNIEHAFDGFILNKLPLIKKLKWREFVMFKAVYGGLDAANDPKVTPSVYSFPTDAQGQSLTYGFKKNVPYMEAGFGIGNIFKLFRVDVTRRLNYLDNPNTSKWRVQGQILFDF